MNTTLISVALVTRNRPESLERTLKSLRQQDCQPFEVVVSDDSDIDHQAAVRNLAQQYDCRYIEGPRRGLYANRNHVALACRGTHIRTMDDDHEFPEGHWEVCEKAVRSDSLSIWIIGEYYPWSVERISPPPCPGQLHPRGFSTPPPNTQNCWSLSDGASIFPKTVFENGHRYAEMFAFGASYLEFGSRLHYLGYRLRQLTSAWVLHHMDLQSRSFMDNRLDIASRVFAMLCHSNKYQPTSRNKLLTSLQIVRWRYAGPHHAGQAISDAKKAFHEHMINLNK